MPDLHARLLAEIERREQFWLIVEPFREGHYDVTRKHMLAYLAALRAITDMHRNAGGGCHECEYDYPCGTVRIVTTALDVTP